MRVTGSWNDTGRAQRSVCLTQMKTAQQGAVTFSLSLERELAGQPAAQGSAGHGREEGGQLGRLRGAPGGVLHPHEGATWGTPGSGEPL